MKMYALKPIGFRKLSYSEMQSDQSDPLMYQAVLKDTAKLIY